MSPPEEKAARDCAPAAFKNSLHDKHARTLLAAQINAEHESAFGKAREALEHARRAGELLLQVKAEVGHGGFQVWIAEHCDFTARQAQRYMTVSENWAAIVAKYDTVSHLTLRGALKLIDCSATSELERAERFGAECDRVKRDARFRLQAAERIMDDPVASLQELIDAEHQANRVTHDLCRIEIQAAREIGRLLIELKALTKLNESDLLAVLNDGSLIAELESAEVESMQNILGNWKRSISQQDSKYPRLPS